MAKKTPIIMLLWLFSALFFLAGCNSSTQQLVILVPSQGYVEYLQDTLAAEFLREHPDYRIRFVTVADTLPTDFENHPDKHIAGKLKEVDLVIGMPYSHYFAIANPQNFADLSEFLSSGSMKESIYAPILEGLLADDGIFALPAAFYSSFLLTNVNLKEKYNVGNITLGWENVLESARAIAFASDDQIYGISIGKVNDNFSGIFNAITYPLNGNVFDQHRAVNAARLNAFAEYFGKGLDEGVVSGDLGDFFSGKSLYAFVNLYDIDYYLRHFEHRGQFDIEISAAPFFNNGTSYVIPGDLMAISTFSLKQEIAFHFVEWFISNYANYYDPGSFGWFSVIRSPKQIKYVEQFNLPLEAIYPDLPISRKEPQPHDFNDLAELNARLNRCFASERDHSDARSFVACFSNS
jgi:ABC-type glycerol-3-phosphate transport system substrate-binding protein